MLGSDQAMPYVVPVSQPLEDVTVSASSRRVQSLEGPREALVMGYGGGLSRQATLSDAREARADLQLSVLCLAKVCVPWPQGLHLVRTPPANARDPRDMGSIPGSGRCPGVGNGNPTPVFLPGKSHKQRSQAGYSPCGRRVGH